MSAVSAKQMAALDKGRQDVLKQTYSAMLQQFCRKIKTSHELGLKHATLTVPPFIIGYPRYDMSKAVGYMYRQLDRLGYTVDLAGPMTFTVRWNKATPGQPAAAAWEDEPVDFPGLANLQKTAQKLRVVKNA